MADIDLWQRFEGRGLSVKEVFKQFWDAETLAPKNPVFIHEKDYPMLKSKSDLDHAVFHSSVEDLVNMWLARYGPDWIEKNDVTNDDFFSWAAMRLKSAGKLEEHKVWEPTPHTVLRLIE